MSAFSHHISLWNLCPPLPKPRTGFGACKRLQDVGRRRTGGLQTPPEIGRGRPRKEAVGRNRSGGRSKAGERKGGEIPYSLGRGGANPGHRKAPPKHHPTATRPFPDTPKACHRSACGSGRRRNACNACRERHASHTPPAPWAAEDARTMAAGWRIVLTPCDAAALRQDTGQGECGTCLSACMRVHPASGLGGVISSIPASGRGVSMNLSEARKRMEDSVSPQCTIHVTNSSTAIVP